MIYVALPNSGENRNVTFYLAMEEYIARNLSSQQEYFFMWQVRPSVIFGRNQLIYNEVNLEYCKAHGINVFRRKSGGGCVYADMNNIMFSYITPDDNPVNVTFDRYIGMIVSMLQKLGVKATSSGRNDIMVEGRKLSGNAFYHIPGRSIVHGTMLYDTDMQNMVGAITPSNQKLVSKGVESVRQRITLLKDHTGMDIEQFKTFAKTSLCSDTMTLGEADTSRIESIEAEYLTDEFIYGNNPRYNISRKKRIEGVGDFAISIEMKNGTIKDIDIKGDFFLVGDIGKTIVQPLRGCHLSASDIAGALPDRLDDIILNLQKDDFVNLLINPNDNF